LVGDDFGVWCSWFGKLFEPVHQLRKHRQVFVFCIYPAVFAIPVTGRRYTFGRREGKQDASRG
jgi:hypothetical protein